MPDENRVFDVSRPGHGSPQATSKPVIVGHHPVMKDPMFKAASPPRPKTIAVHDANHYERPASEPQSIGEAAMGGPEIPVFDHPSEPANLPQPEVAPESSYNPVFPSSAPPPAAPDTRPLEPLTPAPARGMQVHKARRSRGPLWILLALLAVLIAGYLLIDSGTINSNIKLPFHVFKQKTPAPAVSNTNSNQNQTTTSSVPAGFTVYKISGTELTFAAPNAWGTPTSTNDPGYSVRGGTNKSDGTAAYLVDFATNKDVEIAVTSAKYLPAARGALYYDYLAWCTGTADGKIYTSLLHTTTAADKTEKPSTVTCDQGPFPGATKLDDSTIVELSKKSADGKTVIGDLYTKNLDNTDLPVFRVKDAKMASSDDIKQLLNTVKIPATSTTSSAASQ